MVAFLQLTELPWVYLLDVLALGYPLPYPYPQPKPQPKPQPNHTSTPKTQTQPPNPNLNPDSPTLTPTPTLLLTVTFTSNYTVTNQASPRASSRAWGAPSSSQALSRRRCSWGRADALIPYGRAVQLRIARGLGRGCTNARTHTYWMLHWLAFSWRCPRLYAVSFRYCTRTSVHYCT